FANAACLKVSTTSGSRCKTRRRSATTRPKARPLDPGLERAPQRFPGDRLAVAASARGRRGRQCPVSRRYWQPVLTTGTGSRYWQPVLTRWQWHNVGRLALAWAQAFAPGGVVTARA